MQGRLAQASGQANDPPFDHGWSAGYVGVGCSRVYRHWQESNALRRRLYLGSTQPPAYPSLTFTDPAHGARPRWQATGLLFVVGLVMCTLDSLPVWGPGPPCPGWTVGDLARIEGRRLEVLVCSACPMAWLPIRLPTWSPWALLGRHLGTRGGRVRQRTRVNRLPRHMHAVFGLRSARLPLVGGNR